MALTKKKYTPVLKNEIVSQYKSGEKTIDELSTEYCIPKTTLQGWIKKADEVTFPDGRIFSIQDLLCLEKYCQDLERENSFLKKTANRFSV